MRLTCAQMEILLSFYIEGELSDNLKHQVEEHLKECPTCANNYSIIKNMVKDVDNKLSIQDSFFATDNFTNEISPQDYGLFRTNLSAYIDNELSGEECIKIKKFTINNNKARKDLSDSYNIRRLMRESFKRTNSDLKKDFSKKILRQLETNDTMLNFHPAIKFLIIFTISVIVLFVIILFYIS